MDYKNLIAGAFAFALAASTASCSSSNSDSSSQKTEEPETTTVQEETTAEEITEEATEEELIPPVPTECDNPDAVTFDDGDFSFAEIISDDEAAAVGELSVVEVMGNKMLRFADDNSVPLEGKVQKLSISAIKLIGAENLPKVRKIEFDLYAQATAANLTTDDAENVLAPGWIGGGGGTGLGSSGPTVIAGSMTKNPLTGKQMFVSQTGQIYRNTWINAELTGADGKATKTWIYVDANGDAAAGWQWIRCKDGQIRRFYFSEAKDATYGFCYMNRTTPDGNTVDGSGYWTVNGAVQLSGQETVTRIPAVDPNEAAKAAAERAKSASELGYVPGQLVLKTTGNRQQIDVYVALMGGTVAGVAQQSDGSSIVTVNIAAHTTVATAETLYKANPLFTGVTKNYVLKSQ